MNYAIKIAGYLGCLSVGALISWYFTKKYYDNLVNEEIQSIREIHRREENIPMQRHDIEEYDKEIKEYKYFDSPEITTKTEKEPYLIPTEIFDDVDPSYEKIYLDYYTENDCLVENGKVIDPNISIGINNLIRFAKRMDLIVMYIRNEKIGVDYEVTKIVSKWTE